MSRPMSAPSPLRRFGGDEGGEAMIGFALVLPMLVLLTIGTLEFMLSVFDYHRAGEATRRGARAAAIADIMVGQDALAAAGTVTCASNGTAVTCGGAGALAPVTFTAVVADMQAILPTLTAANVEVVYGLSGLGDITTPGGLIPMVTVRLKSLRHEYLMVSGLPGLGSGFTFPPLATSRVAGGMGGA